MIKIKKWVLIVSQKLGFVYKLSNRKYFFRFAPFGCFDKVECSVIARATKQSKFLPTPLIPLRKGGGIFGRISTRKGGGIKRIPTHNGGGFYCHCETCESKSWQSKNKSVKIINRLLRSLHSLAMTKILGLLLAKALAMTAWDLHFFGLL